MSMERRQSQDVAYDDVFWVDPPSLGTIGYLSGEQSEGKRRVILVPDGAGDYREHHVTERPKGRLGF